MVLISKKQRDFNDDMGAYLDSRNTKSDSDSVPFFKKVDSLIPIRKAFSSSSDKDVPQLSNAIESTVYDDDAKPSFFGRIVALFGSSSSSARDLDEEVETMPEDIQEEIHEIEDEITEVDQEVEELEEKRESLIKRFFSIFRSNRSKPIEEEEPFEHAEDVELDPNEVLKAETRQTLKIIHKWISRLPPEQIDAFKRSPDFARYKELLEKYNLLK